MSVETADETSDVPPEFLAGAGRLCLDFVRTLHRRGRVDEHDALVGARDLVAWAARFGPCHLEPEPEPDALAGARTLREACYELLTAAAGPDGPRSCSPAAREVINAAAAHPPPVPWIDAGGAVTHHADRPVAATLALVAHDTLDLVVSPDLARLRRCADPECAIFFVDRSRPGTRRWCSMNRCGNRAKKATFRDRGAAS